MQIKIGEDMETKDEMYGHATLRVFENKPELSCFGIWSREDLSSTIGVTLGVSLPSNADEKLIGKHITWEDEPIEI